MNIIIYMNFDDFDISLGIRQNGKLITINKKQKIAKLHKILKNHTDNTKKLKKENKKLEKQLKLLNKEQNNFFDYSNIEIKSLSDKSIEPNNEYDSDNITFTNKTKIINKKPSLDINKILLNQDKSFIKIKKNIIIELKKYFKKNNYKAYNKILDIGKTLQKSNYDTYLLDYNDNLYVNKDCKLLQFNTDKTYILFDYITNIFLDNKMLKQVKISKFENSYKTIKMIAKYMNCDVILLNEKLDTIDEFYSKVKNILYFLFINNKIYAIDNSINTFYKFKLYIKKSLNLCLSRDYEKNSILVLFDDLDNYKDSYIHFPKIKYSIFKYSYLLNNLYLTKIGDLTQEQIDILKYLVKYFGLHFSLISAKKYINKKDLTLDFINIHLNYSIDNISLFDYKHYNKSEIINEIIQTEHYKKYEDFDYYYPYKNTIICGITKNEIYNKCFEKFNIKINLNDIKKSYSYMDFNSIKTQENINIILSLFQNTDNLCIFDTTNRKLLSHKKMNFDDLPTFDYIMNLYEKIKICKICGCNLTLDRKDKNKISIDAIDPLLGHTTKYNNLDLLCGECNILKGTGFMGKYSEKPYFYDINTLKKDKIIELLNYHKLPVCGIIPTLRKRLDNHIKIIDNY